jgi:hypothetical protein
VARSEPIKRSGDGERGAAPDSAVRRWGGQSTEKRSALILAAIMALRGASFLRAISSEDRHE